MPDPEAPTEVFVGSLERKIETTLTSDFWSISLPAALETSAALAPQLLAFRAAQVVLSAPVLFSDKKVRDLLDPAMRPPTNVGSDCEALTFQYGRTLPSMAARTRFPA